MEALTVYNRAGGQGKSVLTRDLAAAYAEQGHRALILDLDAQKGSVTNFYNLDYDKNDGSADRLTLHIIDKPAGEFDDLIYNAEPGVDIIPGHEELNDLGDILDDKEAIETRGVDSTDWNRYAQLLQVLKENNVPDRYDVLICDPNAKADEAYYSALFATRNVLIPAATTTKGVDSIEDVTDTATNFANEMEINIGNLGVVATKSELKQKNKHQKKAEELRDEYNAICYFKLLSAYDNAADAGHSLFTHINELDRVRNSQTEILPKYRTLLAHIRNEMGNPIPDEPLRNYDMWTGDDFWGDVPIPTETKKMEAQ